MINYLLLIPAFCLALVISYLITPLMRKFALRKGIFSIPNKRSVHSKPVPYLGGVAIYFAFLISSLFILYLNPQFAIDYSEKIMGLLIAGTLIVALGTWDDIKNIRPLIKLIGQIGIALLLFAYGFRIELLTDPFLGGEIKIPLLWSMLVTVGWIIGLINAMNLIDGLDGLAGGITVIVCGSFIFIAAFLNNHLNIFLLTILAGSILGFLHFNFYPSKIFMGDAGSMFLGLILAAVALIGFQFKSATAVALLVPITALAIPLYDTAVAVVRRILGKKSIFRADKEHLHHRLLTLGLRQDKIVIFIYLLTLYLGIFAFLFVLIPDKYALLLLILLGLGMFIGVRVVGFVERNARMIDKLKSETISDEAEII